MRGTAFIHDNAQPAPGSTGRFFAADTFIRGEQPLPESSVPLTIACEQRGYLSSAYYASLIAEARGHAVFPRASDMLIAQHTRPPTSRKPTRNYSQRRIAVLLTPSEQFGASSAACMLDFARHAERRGISVDVIDKRQIEALDRADALFIRDQTSPTNHTYAFARQAKALGIPVIDDPESIIRCSNKIFVHERLRCHGISTPRTLVMTPGLTIQEAIEAFGLPLVLKVPNGSFSLGVNKILTAEQGERVLGEMRRETSYLLAQEYMPTQFDWRVGLLNGEPLYACQYHMVRGHWQIIQHREGKSALEGQAIAVPLAEVPWGAIEIARRAAGTIGMGLYGVDVKHSGDAFHVVEVNDNPDIYSDFEAAAASDQVWERLVTFFEQQMLIAEQSRKEPQELPRRRAAAA